MLVKEESSTSYARPEAQKRFLDRTYFPGIRYTGPETIILLLLLKT